MKKSVEELIELSKETLKKYIPVADRQGRRARSSETIKRETGHGSDWDTKEYKKMADKREKGVKTALRKVYRKNQLGEEVELSEANLLAHYIGNGNQKAAKIYSKNAYGEHTVKHFHAGKHQKDADYHTNDLTDAHGTAKHHVGDSHVVEKGTAKRLHDRLHGEEVQPIEELSNTTYKSYSKKSSRDADKHINRFLKGGNEKSITHAEKRSKGINTAQQLMARKKMTVEEKEMETVADAKKSLPSWPNARKKSWRDKAVAGTGKGTDRSTQKEEVEQIDEWKSIKGVDLEKVRADAKKNGKIVSLQHGEGDSLYKVVSPRKTQKEEVELNETMTRKHFQQVADVIKSHPDPKKREELAHHHAAIFKASNPRFDHARFFKAADAKYEVKEGVELEEKDTHNKNIAKEYLRSTDSRHSSYDGPEDAADADSMARHRASKKHGYDSDAFDHHVKKQAGKKDVIMSRINKRVSKSSDPRDVVNHNGKYIQKRDRKSQQEETEMEYNEEKGHIDLVNAIMDGNRDEANELFDAVVSGRLNPVLADKKAELAATLFTTEIEEAYEPLPLTEEQSHGHHHRVHAELTDRMNNLSDDAHNAFMRGEVTKEHKKEVVKYASEAGKKLDAAKDKLGSAESADHLNTAAVHITAGNSHLYNVRAHTSLGFRSY